MKKVLPLFLCLCASVCSAAKADGRAAVPAGTDTAAPAAEAPADSGKKAPSAKKAGKTAKKSDKTAKKSDKPAQEPDKSAKERGGPAREEAEVAPEAAAAPAEPRDAAVAPVELSERGFYDTWIRGRLSIGVGVAWSTLTDAKRSKDKANGKTFVGFIYELEDEDQFAPLPVVSYWIPDYLRLSLSWDSVSGRTRNYNTETRHSDGVASISGPAALAELTLPLLDESALLHAGVGAVWASGDFEEDSWWHLGYSSEAAWKTRGSPKKPAGHYREIRVDDSVAFLCAAGLAWRPAEHLELDFSVRYVRAEPDCEFGYAHRFGFEVRERGDFTLDHLSLAATLSYVF